VPAGIVDKAGAWFSYNGERIGQGRDNVRDFLRERPAMAIEIENRVREKLGVVPRVGGAPATSATSASVVTAKASAAKASKLVASEPEPDEDL
jgi:recombination protein RecA